MERDIRYRYGDYGCEGYGRALGGIFSFSFFIGYVFVLYLCFTAPRMTVVSALPSWQLVSSSS